MNFRWCRRLMFMLLLYGIPVFSQQITTVRIGLAIPHSGTKEVSDAAMRDALIKALNRKADKKRKMALQAVPIEQPPGSKAIAEANQNSCSFVLYVVVRSITTSDHPVPSGTGGIQGQQVQTATVEYQIRRANDGAPYAIGTAQGQGEGSDRDAILKATERVSGLVLAEFEKGDHSGLDHAALDHAALAGNGEKETSTPAPRDISVETSFCGWLPTSISHADALRGVCEYAATLPQKMPNFVCQQVTSRYEGEHHIPDDLITGTVRYEDGEESYSGLMRNGKPIPASMLDSAGLWTNGQLEGSLRAIFHSANHAVFEFSREDHIGERRAWVFTYEIARQNEPLWVLRAQDQVTSPPYRGEVWVDPKTGELRRFTSAAQQMPTSFPMKKAESATDYNNVPFGDGTAFVLPSQSTIATAYAGQEPTRNEVQLRSCHKFRATAHLVASVPGAEDTAASAANSSEALRAELEDNNTIYEILREQAIRDDEAFLEAEQRFDLNVATVRALWKVAALEREREKKESAGTPISKNSPAAPTPPISTLKVSVNLVPVLVVLRKANGEAVGNLPKESFQLFDNGKPQAITRFAVESPGGPRSSVNEPSSTAGAAGGTEAPNSEAPRSVAYIFDDLHLASADLGRARDAAAEELAKLTAVDHAAVFATSGEGSVDFTSDRDKLQSALRGLKSHADQDAGGCPPMTYYEAEEIVNRSDTSALSLAMADTMECAHTTRQDEARRLAESAAFDVLSRGQMESRRALDTLRTVLSRVALMPGERSTVLVSPGFLTTVADLREKAMSLIANAVQDGVVVNVLDATGLTVTGVSANRSHSTDAVEQSQLENNDILERSELLADLAYGTGGIFFHNNNDLKEGFRRTSEPPEFVYVLGFAPQKLDGKFHKLKVKVANRNLTVQARQGYYAHE